MALLGKTLKGRSSKSPAEKKQRIVQRIRAIVSTDEAAQEEKLAGTEKRNQLKKNLAEEKKLTRFNKEKLLTQWRRVMRLAKTDQLHEQIEIYQQNHEREIDAKDAILQMLDRDLEEADEQYQMALRNHFIHVQQLLQLQDNRLQGLEQEFLRDYEIIKAEFEKERQEIDETHKLEKKEWLDIMQAVEDEEKNKDDEAKANHETIRETARNKMIEDINQLRVALNSKTDKLDREFDLQYNRYTNETSDKTQTYRLDFAQNKKDTQEIEKKNRRLEELKDKILHWKLKTHFLHKECKARNLALQRESKKVQQHYRELKSKMMKFREEQIKKLTDLTTNAKNCGTKLKDLLQLGERILKTAELCRKLETEKEKVLPFYEQDPESLQEEKRLLEESKDMTELKLLDNFHKRFNKVLLDKIAIEKQKTALQKENQFFKSLLKQYLDGVSVNEDVMSQANPLLVVNNRVNLNRPVKEMAEKPVIEANIVMRNRAKQ